MMVSFDTMFVLYSVALFLGAAAWGAILSKMLVPVHSTAPRSNGHNGETWRTVVYQDVDVTKLVSFICEKEDSGERFLSETRADGDRFGTLYFAKRVA